MQNINSYKLPAIENWLRSDLAMYFILTLIMLLAYGYEIFNFNLTIDDELHAHAESHFLGWLAIGRWGMGLLSYVVLPHPVTPVVSTALGVSGIAIGMLIVIKSIFNMDRIGILSITALGATIPTFPFILVFSGNGYGIGIGFITMSIANLLIQNKNIHSLITACLLAAFAISVYQTFVFILAILVITQIWYFHIKSENTNLSVYHATYPILFFLGSVTIYLGVDFIFQQTFSTKSAYISNIIDITEFISNPLNEISFAYNQLLDIINLEPKFVGIQSIWLKIALFTSLTAIMVNLFKQFRFTIGIIIVTATISLIMIFSLSLTNVILLRALIHIPFGIAIILAYSYTLSGKYMKPILIIIYALTIIGNAAISNHLFASAVSAEFQDKMLAYTIINEVRRLKPENAQNAEYKIEIIGNHTWPTNAIQSRHDIIGASFFEWGDGDKYRIAAYLRLNGLNVIEAEVKDKIGLCNQIKNIPVWPKAGWVSIIDDILVLKFSDYSEAQKKSCVPQV